MKNKKPKLTIDINASASRSYMEWSGDSTNILIQAWAQYVEDGKLPKGKWPSIVTAVNDKVTAMGLDESARTQSQCRRRMDAMKNKYKSERARVLASNGRLSSSDWPHYHLFHNLLGDFTLTTQDDDQEELQDDGFTELAGAIKSFGESYLRIKEEKLKQIKELEKQRIESIKSLELEKIKLLRDIAKMMLGKDIIPSEEPKNTPAPQNSEEV